jgi:hypothetical protein
VAEIQVAPAPGSRLPLHRAQSDQQPQPPAPAAQSPAANRPGRASRNRHYPTGADNTCTVSTKPLRACSPGQRPELRHAAFPGSEGTFAA